MSEFDLIARIADILGSAGPGVELGIGDDAAVLSPSAKRSVITVDAAVEGVHFRRDWMDLEDIGYRATVAAASDILAMGATPRAAVAAWTIPPGVDDDTVCAIAAGQREAAALLGLSIVGGNITAAPVLSITTTVIGEADRVITRSGARPGDVLVLAGAVGEAALGIAALQKGRADIVERAVRAYRRPRVLLSESRVLAATANAMIDVSDGLAQDLGHMAAASGVKIVIWSAWLLAGARFEEAARELSVNLEELQLCGGDDYALVAAAPAHHYADYESGMIGFVEEGSGVEILRGQQRFPAPKGYTHR